MKKTLLVFLLPLMAFGQPIERQSEWAGAEVTMAFNFQSKIETLLVDHSTKMYAPTLFFSSNVSSFQINENEAIFNIKSVDKEALLPRHLNTFSLTGLYPTTHELSKPKKRLFSLLALNDPDFPKENTLIKGLNPVRHSSYTLNKAENGPQNFGPRIQI